MLNDLPETLRTELQILGQVACRRALPETLIPRKRNKLAITVTRANGSVETLAPTYNSRVNAGASWQASLMGSAAGTPANYLALSVNTLVVATGDTVLSGEISANGCARALGTYQNYTAPSVVGGAASYQIAHTFTASGAQTINSAALFNASSSGTLFVEANLSNSVSLQNGDSLLVSWTVNV